MKQSTLTPQQAAIDAAVQAALAHGKATGQACVVFVMDDDSVLAFYGSKPLRAGDEQRIRSAIFPESTEKGDINEHQT